ncbi:DUF1989 domain-containing protein [Thioclava sp. GXIMD4215]|uniref:DUF1989 domain-containing protein n=1 Tax=Thioclava sp. GXIMD4215 TaxID=3131928 RepID=UPI00311B25AE
MTLFSDLPLFRPGAPLPTHARRVAALGRPRGTEHYTIPGRGAYLVRLAEGDQITLTNLEGGQAALLLVTHPEGRPDAGLIGARADSPLAPLQALLRAAGSGMERLRRGLERRNIPLEGQGIGLFGQSSPAGDQARFTARSAGWLLLAAPAPVMDFETQNTATPIGLLLHRAHPGAQLRHALPDPLAEPLQDLRIASATARAYRIAKGDYIQIIDVDGRQCTDFQCFDARKLDRGQALPLDVTTTRSLQALAYPMPGLHGKYFDQDMTPLVEVIQDTCGRHDAFALACSAKYYDDLGYPGHVNCSENFNAALAPYDIAGRAGWMAANFFFNTAIDQHGVLVADEPWSRPGDYVLLRALTDLVCVSSACPDDTSAANGWDLTDIHMRSYSGAETFSRAAAWRPTPEDDPIMTRESGFHASFAPLTRNFTDYRGFWLPDSFTQTDPVESYWACREKAVIMDLSALRKFEVTGPDAKALLNWVLTRDVSKLGSGQVVYSAMCYPHGGMIDDGTLFRLGPQNFRWIGGSDLGGTWMREEAARLGLNVMIRSSTDQQHNIAVQGPAAREILKTVLWTAPHQPALTALEWFRFTVGRLGGPDGVPLVVSRTGYTGELGYEIFCHPRDAKQVFEAVWAAGQPCGLRPMGLAGLDLVRIEAGLIFAGYDFDDQTDPFEAGIGFTVPLKSKTADFVGREALIRRKQHPARVFVGLEIEGEEAVSHGDCLRLGRAQIGVVCSAMHSPRSHMSIALARVDVAHSASGTLLEVGQLDGHLRRRQARISPVAHYDPKKERPRS